MRTVSFRATLMAFVVVLGTKAVAFDLGPHLDMAEDMMTAEGFSSDSIRFVQTGLCSFLSNKSSKVQGKDLDRETFDAGWRILSLSTKRALADCAQKKDVEEALLTLAESLRAVQEFYSQTNWASLQGVPADSTWFDLPVAKRAGIAIKVREREIRGSDHSDYERSYVQASLATRQWIRAARLWTGNEVFWRSLLTFRRAGNELKHYLDDAWRQSAGKGEWNGNTGLAGVKAITVAVSLPSFVSAARADLEKKRGDTETKEGEVRVQPTSTFRNTGAFVALRIHSLAIEGGTSLARKPLWYGVGTIGGQRFRSAVAYGRPSVSFERPFGPPTFIKFVPKQTTSQVPLSTIRITLTTGSDEAAGSDMRLFLRINDSERYDFYSTDMPRGQTRSFTFVPNGVTLDQLKFVQLEKQGGSDWQLQGIQVEVNGASVYRNDHVGAWMRSVNQTWRIPGALNLSRYTSEIPIYLELWDGDWSKHGVDDQADINPLKGRQGLQLLYNPGTGQVRLDAKGSGKILSKGAGDALPMSLEFSIAELDDRPARGSS